VKELWLEILEKMQRDAKKAWGIDQYRSLNKVPKTENGECGR